MRMGKKKFLSLIIAIAVSLISVVPAFAATTVQNSLKNTPQSLEELFDAQFYSYKYPEVVNVVGNDKAALFKHFKEYGMAEGRTCSAVLNVVLYKANYPDVAETYGNDWDKIVKHYFKNGIKEGRQSFVSSEDLAIEQAILAGLNANRSDIINNIDSAIQQAVNSQSGYVQDPASGIIASADGDALIPWDVIQEEGRIQDIEELYARCGDDLILIRDGNNNIKFVGGRFSNVKVSDETSALKALDTMANLYGNIEEKSYLKLSDSGIDSLGNPYYRFVPVDKEVGFTQDRYTVTISADKDGNVLGASNALDSSLYGNGNFAELADGWGENLQSVLDDPANGYIKLFEQPKLVYDVESKNYYWAMYYEKNGVVNEYLVDTVDGAALTMTKYYDAETFKNNPEQSFNRDYEFKNLNNLKEMTFIDYFNNPVKLSVAYEEGKGWYIVDPDRHMVCVETASMNRNVDRSQLFDRHYFSDEYFDAVNAYINGGEASEALENEKVLIQSYTTLQASYDEYKKMGMLPNPKTIYVNYKYNDTDDNANQSTLADMIVFTIHNNEGNADFGGISHEFGHAVVANQGQALPYRAATGAIDESYADILGSLMKMIKKQEGEYAGNVDYQRWLIGEFLGSDTQYVIRDMSNPNNNGRGGDGKNPSAIQINDQYFVQDPGKYDEDNDFGGVHANNSILSHICYRMYNEVFADKDENGNGIPDQNKYRDLLKVWYDSVVYVNHDSTYADIKGYVLQAMKNHGYSQDMISRSEQIFNDANVDEYKPFDSTKSAAEVYDDNDMAAAAKVGNKMSGQNELYNYMDSENALREAEYDLGIALDEYKIAQLQGMSAEELKAYENQIDIARNTVELNKNNVTELYNSFTDSQLRIKNILDGKMDQIEKQGEALKQVAEAKETNPNLTRAYRALRQGLKSNLDTVSDIKSGLDEAVREFSDEEKIINVYESVWNFDANGLNEDVQDDTENYTDVQYDGLSYDELWDSYLNEFFDSLDVDGLDVGSLDDIDWDNLFDAINWDDIFGDINWDDWSFDNEGSTSGDDDWSSDGDDDRFSGDSWFDDWTDDDWNDLIDEVFDWLDD